MSTLAVIPAFMREPPDLELTVGTIESILATDPSVDVLVVDDGSPARALVDELEGATTARLKFELHRCRENRGFSAAVNVGLARALAEGRDVALLNADVEILTPDWSLKMSETRDRSGAPAWVVGAMLLYPGGELIQHAGAFFSFLTRVFDHRFRYAPATLPEANVPCRCPVTAAFQWIRHECLETVGLYDEGFRMGYEDVDYCLRVFSADRECIYRPDIRAMHYESMFRGRADRKIEHWQHESGLRLMFKHRKTKMGDWMVDLA